jgi:DNA polymerase V
MTGYYVLVDCNNFFVSCERVFNPSLEGKPVVVLSSNDGCVVSRSEEVKRLGVRMGAPYFTVRDICLRHHVVVYSSNYQLYGDLSGRVMAVLAMRNPDLQVYSIDEAFLWYPPTMTPEEVVAESIEIRRRVMQWVGIPTSLGIAPTKTLAKVATKRAKGSTSGVIDITSPVVREEILRRFPIRDVWGVGARCEEALHAMGIQSAWDLCTADPLYIRRRLGVSGERMVWELQGVSCLPLEEASPNQSMTCSRSFGENVACAELLGQALSTHVASVCERLRRQHVCASAMSVYLVRIPESSDPSDASKPKDSIDRSRYVETTVSFPMPTSNTPQAIRAAKECLSRLFVPGQRYKKCGVVMIGLMPEESVAPDLFLSQSDDHKTRICHKEALFYGATGIDRRWKARCDLRSPRYTTCWNELARVR